MFPVSLAGHISALPPSSAETPAEPCPQGQQESASLAASCPLNAFVAQNGAHPLLSGLTSSQSTTDAKSAPTSLLREAQTQMQENDALQQQAKAAEAQMKAKVWSVVPAVISVVIAEVPSVQSAPGQDVGPLVLHADKSTPPPRFAEPVGAMTGDLP